VSLLMAQSEVIGASEQVKQEIYRKYSVAFAKRKKIFVAPSWGHGNY